MDDVLLLAATETDHARRDIAVLVCRASTRMLGR